SGGAGNGSFTGQVYSVDRTAPTLSSINRSGTNPTNAGPLGFTLTFSEPVNGVVASNFALATSNIGGTTPVIGTPSATGGAPSATWTVNVTTVGTTGANNGSIGLNLANNTNIKDVATNNLFTVFATGQAYAYDTTAPTVTVNQAGGQVDPTNVLPINFT